MIDHHIRGVIAAAGFAIFFPACFGADPWIGSKTPMESPRFAPTTNHSPPIPSAPTSLGISPFAFSAKMTLNCSGHHHPHAAMIHFHILHLNPRNPFYHPLNNFVKSLAPFDHYWKCSVSNALFRRILWHPF
jgi:hypothetical protein